MDYSLLGEDWNSLKRVATPDSVRRDLDIARSRGARVFVQFAQSHHHYQNPDGSFNLDKFKQMLDRYKELDLDSYVADGTIAGHFLLDEPNDPSNWGGRGLPYEMIEAAAEHSKLLWPTLPALIRSRPTWLAKAPFRWKYLDGGWSQYVTRFGDVEHFRDAESQAARQAGLMVVWGLNVLDGGDGSSRKTGTKPNRYTMSPAELRRYGETLIGVPGSCGFLLWRYDSGYVSDGAVLTALKSLRDQARSLPLQSCLRAQ